MPDASALAKGLFLSATDTGVGKTFVGCALGAWLNAREVAVGVMKPVETGGVWRVVEGKRRLVGRDALALARCAGFRASLDHVNPYCYREPIAPEGAAERFGAPIRWAVIRKAHQSLRRQCSVLLVEGAGGLWVPLNRKLIMYQLARRFRLPVLLVTRPGLGTINHTMLSLEHLSRERIPVAGVVMNYAAQSSKTLWGRWSERENPKVIRRYSGVPFLGCLPHAKSTSRTSIPSSWPERYLDLKYIQKFIDA